MYIKLVLLSTAILLLGAVVIALLTLPFVLTPYDLSFLPLLFFFALFAHVPGKGFVIFALLLMPFAIASLASLAKSVIDVSPLALVIMLSLVIVACFSVALFVAT